MEEVGPKWWKIRGKNGKRRQGLLNRSRTWDGADKDETNTAEGGSSV